MNTDWEAVLFVAVMAAVPLLGFPLIFRGACRDMELLRRRLESPSGAANGTGVERAPLTGQVAVALPPALPRSPQAVVGVVDPRPSAPTAFQPPVGPTVHPPVPTGAIRRVVVHG